MSFIFSELYIQYNTELNDMKIIIYLRKSEVSVERISVCNDSEKLAEHNIHCLLCSGTIEVINVTIATKGSY